MPTNKNKTQEYFQSLHVKNIIQLSLIIPHSFENTCIVSEPIDGISGVVEIEITSQKSKGFTLFLDAFCITWNLHVKLLIFNAKPYHYAIFKNKCRLYVLGKFSYSLNTWQILQPKVVNKTNEIIPKYKTSLKNNLVLKLIQEYVNEANLLQAGLKPEIVKILLDIHVNDINSINLLREPKDKKVLYALKYAEIFDHIKTLQSKKINFPNTTKLLGDESDFISSLPFELTNDQKKTILDIKKDFKGKYLSKRVIMGDVGCGKTIIIFASVMMALPFRSILLVPTTILARQIYEEAKKYLNINITLVTTKEKNENLDKFDFIIGTHALLYRELPKCELVMIDEQHRFGTRQRQLIHNLVSLEKNKPHFLQFSATPIPRTLSLINSSLVDYSFIKEMPFKKDIDTHVIHKKDFALLIDHIDTQIKHNRQIIIVYPLVEESQNINYQSLDEGRSFWENKYQNVYVTYGKDKQKETIMEEFAKNGSILLSTTVVEVGISLPKLSTIIIVGAERLGLASLHQLRGRVARNGLKGHCFLFTYTHENQRLNEFASTKNGFEIAELDLKYRQGGDILNGLIQHGKEFKFFDFNEDEEILLEAKKDLNLSDET